MSANNLGNLRQSPFYRLYNYGYYGDNNNNIHYNNNDEHTDKINLFKGSGRQCMVVELRMQYCGELCWDSFETYITF